MRVNCYLLHQNDILHSHSVGQLWCVSVSSVVCPSTEDVQVTTKRQQQKPTTIVVQKGKIFGVYTDMIYLKRYSCLDNNLLETTMPCYITALQLHGTSLSDTPITLSV